MKTKLRLLMAISVLLIIGSALWLRDRSDADQNQRDVLLAKRLDAMRRAPNNAPGDVPQDWKASGAKEKAAAQKAISDQLAAFRKDDYKSAARWQSRGLRDNFPSIEAFRSAITQGYPQFAHSKSVRYGKSVMTPDGVHLQIQVFVTGQDDVKVAALYFMAREDGLYRVESVLPMQPAAPENAPDAVPVEPGITV